jgi:hypothetical protein
VLQDKTQEAPQYAWTRYNQVHLSPLFASGRPDDTPQACTSAETTLCDTMASFAGTWEHKRGREAPAPSAQTLQRDRYVESETDRLQLQQSRRFTWYAIARH